MIWNLFRSQQAGTKMAIEKEIVEDCEELKHVSNER